MAAFTASVIPIVSFILITLAVRCHATALIEGLYCGKKNCYDVLGINRDSDKQDIAKSYRRLARKYHPDVSKESDPEEKFREVANAYEILKDDESRRDYDYMLDHPEEFYGHYYRYYRRRMSPQVDVRVVIAGVITFVSIFQYMHGWWRYNDAMKYLLNEPKYRTMAVSKANELGLLSKIERRKRPKEDVKADEEAVLRKMLEENVDVRGGYSRPSLWDVMWVRVVLLPYTLVLYVIWWFKWQWTYFVMKQEYTEEDRHYLTRKALKLTTVQWESIGREKQSELIEKELWVNDNFQAYTNQQQEEMKAKYAESAKYRRYRRYMKNHKPGPIVDSD
ncbi:dnaJ homolog subfamily C member 25 homolog [Corticium candelabrum]|uniref:dnaJ homolog subfamily C member 25 homolog n=1 Tax=Corticium candelabrum TaxID=121492 RepID=UPI002E264EA7|nr:dnaJ homolog subfamily C member 25 homolog [Corticium candelabrum]